MYRALAISLELWGTKQGKSPRTPVSPKSTSYSELSFTLRFAMIAAYLVSLEAGAVADARIPCQKRRGAAFAIAQQRRSGLARTHTTAGNSCKLHSD